MAKRAMLASVGLVVCVAASVSAERPKSKRVYLLAGAEAATKNECLQALTHTLKAEIDQTSGVEAAKSSDEADVRVEVKECAVAGADINTDFELHATRGADGSRNRGGSVGVGIGVPGGGRGKVALIVDNDGRPLDFTSGPHVLPLEDASRVAVRALLEWVRSGEAR